MRRWACRRTPRVWKRRGCDSLGRHGGGGAYSSPVEAFRFRALAATANYLSVDRVDLASPASEACRDMSHTKVSSIARIWRIARYLLQYPRDTWRFHGSAMGPRGPGLDRGMQRLGLGSVPGIA